MLDTNPEYTFVLTFPDWPSFLAKEKAVNDPRKFAVKTFKKGELLFIDYFEGKKFSPVAIIQIYIGKKIQLPELSFTDSSAPTPQ